MSGFTDKITGKAKQAAGDVTNDNQRKAEGKSQETIGNIKDKFNEVSDTVRTKADKAKESLDKHNK